MSTLAQALIAELDGDSLDCLAEMLAPRLAARLVGSSQDEDRWLNAREAAAYVGLPISAVWKRAAAGELPASQDGPRCKLYFKRSDLDAWREGASRR